MFNQNINQCQCNQQCGKAQPIFAPKKICINEQYTPIEQPIICPIECRTVQRPVYYPVYYPQYCQSVCNEFNQS